MLSLHFAEAPDWFAHMIRFYLPSGGAILDTTYGAGKLVSKLPSNIILTKSDMSPEAPDVIQADAGKLPFPETAFDAVVFDPPYLYGRERFKGYDRPAHDFKEKHSKNQTIEEFNLRVLGAAAEAMRVLKVGGLWLVKVGNARLDKTVVSNQQMVIQAAELAGLQFFDENIYVRNGIGVFTNNVVAQQAHGYLLVFKKKVAGGSQAEGGTGGQA